MDILFVYKLLRGCVKFNLLDYINVFTGVNNTRGYLFKIYKSYAKLIIRQNHFVIRYINNWNSLSNNIVCASTCAMFKRQLMVYTDFDLREHAFNAT